LTVFFFLCLLICILILWANNRFELKPLFNNNNNNNNKKKEKSPQDTPYAVRTTNLENLKIWFLSGYKLQKSVLNNYIIGEKRGEHAW